MIFRLETNMGKPHTVSPFPAFFQKHGLSTVVDLKEEIKEDMKQDESPSKPKLKQ